MRKLLIAIASILFFFPNFAYAYEGGILNGKAMYVGKEINQWYYTAKEATDGNISTNVFLDKRDSPTSLLFYDFGKEETIVSYYLKANSYANMEIYFINEAGQNIMTVYPADKKGNIVNLSNPVRARYVAVEGSAYNQTYQVQEFDVFGKQIDKTPPSEIKNVSVYTTTDSAILTWENPSDEDFDGVKLYIDGVFQSSVSKQYRTYTFSNLQPNREYEIKIKTYDTAGNESNGVTITVKTLPPPDVTELKLFPSAYSILAQWINPTDSGFIGNDLYLDGNFITSLDKNATSYTFTNLNPNTSYEVKIVSKYNGGYSSSGQTATAKTTIPTEDVTDLQADAKYDRVKLSWTSPESEFFHHVKIYRKKIEQQSFWDQLFGATAVSAATTSDGYTPMFETNGTYWTDLTVTPDTTYSYKVTSVNTAGNESQGVTIETTTPSEPVPVLTGVATTQNENGDYVVTWTSPTKGTVKVLINGQEYTVVDAATQKVIIPKKDMKLNFFGGYDAKLVPIGEFGTEGKAVQVPTVGETKIDFPFSFNDFIQTVINILAWAAPLILLSFVLVFWRPLVEFIKKMLANAKGGRVKQ